MADTKPPATPAPDPTSPAPRGSPLARPENVRPAPARPAEIGGAPGPDPTRYGDWQHKGRVSDF
jgi:homeobox protein ESX1